MFNTGGNLCSRNQPNFAGIKRPWPDWPFGPL